MPDELLDRCNAKLEDLRDHQGTLQNFFKKWEARHETIIEDLLVEMHRTKGLQGSESRVTTDAELDNISNDEGRPLDEPSRRSCHSMPVPPLGSRTSRESQFSNHSSKVPEHTFGSVHSMFGQLCMFNSTSSGSNRSMNSRHKSTTRTHGSLCSLPFWPAVTQLHGEPLWKKIAPFARSGAFETMNCMVIFVNVCFLARDADASINHRSIEGYSVVLEWSFCFYYMLELGLRIYGHGRNYCNRKNWAWSCMDWTLVGALIYERVASLLVLSDRPHTGQSLVSFRSIRLIKCVQCFRLVKVMRSFRELRMIASSISGSFKPLLWSFALMVIITFMFGTCLLQATASYLQDAEWKELGGNRVRDPSHDTLRQYWGSIDSAMLSLYAGVTGGEDWMYLAEPLKDVGVVFYSMFVIYIVFYFCVVVNTLTSLFVASTLADAEKDEMQIMLGELERKNRYMKNFSKWFIKLDKDFSGDVSLDEFKQFMNEPDMSAFAARLGIEVVDMQQFFTLLSGGGRVRVDLERFVVGCIKLKGNAKSVDLLDLAYWHSKSVVGLKSFSKACFEEFKEIRKDFDAIRHQLNILQQGQEDLKSGHESLKYDSSENQQLLCPELLLSQPESARSESLMKL